MTADVLAERIEGYQFALDRIEAHQLAILSKLPPLQKTVDCHGDRLDRIEAEVAALKRWRKWGCVLFVVACALSAAVGAWMALRV